MIKYFFTAILFVLGISAFAQESCTEYNVNNWGWRTTEENSAKLIPPQRTEVGCAAGAAFQTYKFLAWHESTNTIDFERSGGVCPTVLYSVVQPVTTRLRTLPIITRDIPIGYFPLVDISNPNYQTSTVSQSITSAGASVALSQYCVSNKLLSFKSVDDLTQVTSTWQTASNGVKNYKVVLKVTFDQMCQDCTVGDGSIAVPTTIPVPPDTVTDQPGIDTPNGVVPPGCEGYSICTTNPDPGTGGGTGGDGTGGGGTGGDGTGGDGTGGDGTGGDGTGGDGTGGGGTGGGGTGGGGTDPDDSDGESETGELCGAPGQPVCKVKIDETGTAEIDETKFQLSEDLETATKDHLDKITGLEDKGGLFDSFRSLFTLPPLRSCEAIQFPEVAGMTVPPMDPCPATDWLRGIMAFVWAAAGLAFCWSCVEEATKV